MNQGVTILIPVYLSQHSLTELVEKILTVYPDDCRQTELLLVDDGSTDYSWEIICQLSRIHPAVRGIRLAGNFGQQNALCCGFAHASHPLIITMDDDLQHDPEEIPVLLDALVKENLDVVYGIPPIRPHPWHRNWGSRLTHHLFQLALGKPKGIRIGSFRAIRGSLARKIAAEGRGFVYVSAATFRHTRKVGNIPISGAPRRYGTSNYSMFRLIRVFLKLLIYHGELPLLSLFRKDTPIYEIAERTPLRLLIAGAGSCQVNAIRRAQDMGYSVIAADYLEDSPGKKIADFQDLASTFDPVGIQRAAQCFGAHGILTLGTDQPVLTCAQVAQELGLPSFFDPHAAQRLTHKKLMKQLLYQHQIPVVPYALLASTDETLPFPYPVVIKPMDSQGQRGVFLCRDQGELVRLFPISLTYSREQELMVEAYYPSDEITISGWVKDGKLTVLTVTDRLIFSSPPTIGICYGHRIPSKWASSLGDEIESIMERIVAAVPIQNGPVYVQMLQGSQGLLVNEIAGRLGGAYEDLMIPLITGFDPLLWSIKAALGQPVWVPTEGKEETVLQEYDFRFNPKYGMMELFFAAPGKISSMTSMEEIKAQLPFIEFGQHQYQVKDEIPSIKYAGQRAGHLFYLARNEEELESRRVQVYQSLQILDEEGSNLVLHHPLEGY